VFRAYKNDFQLKPCINYSVDPPTMMQLQVRALARPTEYECRPAIRVNEPNNVYEFLQNH
jgi:hypothetical protein